MNFVLLPAGGGIGNLIYQHNCAYALAKQHGVKCKILKYNSGRRPNIREYDKLFRHVEFLDNANDNVAISEESFMYNPIILPDNPIAVVKISGYFQSYKYFRPFAEEIRDLFRRNEQETVLRMSTKLAAITTDKAPVCVHIRRGDYLQLSHVHTVLPESYYVKALCHLPQQCMLVIFAENTEEIKSWAVWTDAIRDGHSVHFVDDVPSPLETFFMMSLCHHFIVANSSLSMSAYELRSNADSLLIAPARWFGPAGPAFKIRDIVGETAIVIETNPNRKKNEI